MTEQLSGTEPALPTKTLPVIDREAVISAHRQLSDETAWPQPNEDRLRTVFGEVLGVDYDELEHVVDIPSDVLDDDVEDRFNVDTNGQLMVNGLRRLEVGVKEDDDRIDPRMVLFLPYGRAISAVYFRKENPGDEQWQMYRDGNDFNESEFLGVLLLRSRDLVERKG